MNEFLLGLTLGFILGVFFVVKTSGDTISFYSDYEAVDKDMEKFKQVIELQDKKP